MDVKMNHGKILSIVILFFYLFSAVSVVGFHFNKSTPTSGTSVSSHQNVWAKTYGGKNRDGCFCVQQTSDGGYILTGYTASYGVGGFDLWLLKTDAFGTQEWNKTYGGADWEYGAFVQQTSDGGYIVVGRTELYRFPEDLWLLKTDSQGNKEWDKAFNLGTYEYGYSVQQTRDGGYILVGDIFSWGFPVASIAVWLIKTDSYGHKQWDRIFSGSDDCAGMCVRQTTDGGFIIAGSTVCYGAGIRDIWLIKTDTNGYEEWNKTFGGVYWEEGVYVQQTSDGGFIISGSVAQDDSGVYDIWLVKTDTDGNLQWDKTFGGSEYEEAHSVQQTRDGGYIIGGYTRSFGAGYYDFWLIKTDADGNELWNRTFGGTVYDEGWIVQQTTDNGYIICGHTCSYGAGEDDIWLIKTDEQGYCDDGNTRPNKPDPPEGKTKILPGFKYTYTASTIDIDGDRLSYFFDWDDGTDSGWVGPYDSGAEAQASHIWNHSGEFDIRVKCKDQYEKESEWSDTLTVQKFRALDAPGFILQKLLQLFDAKTWVFESNAVSKKPVCFNWSIVR
jgi:hypothetical protein